MVRATYGANATCEDNQHDNERNTPPAKAPNQTAMGGALPSSRPVPWCCCCCLAPAPLRKRHNKALSSRKKPHGDPVVSPPCQPRGGGNANAATRLKSCRRVARLSFQIHNPQTAGVIRRRPTRGIGAGTRALPRSLIFAVAWSASAPPICPPLNRELARARGGTPE